MTKLSQGQLESSLAKLSGWIFKDNKISKEFLFSDFKEAISFVNDLAELAEREGHHPDIHIFYNQIVLKLNTHDEGGVTEKDINLAKEIDLL